MNSTPNHHAQRIATTSVNLLNLNTPTNLPLVVKEYMCFQVDGKSSQAANYVKSRILNKVVDCIILVDVFEKKCVVIKGMKQSLCLKYHMKTIGIDQSFSNSALF